MYSIKHILLILKCNQIFSKWADSTQFYRNLCARSLLLFTYAVTLFLVYGDYVIQICVKVIGFIWNILALDVVLT